MKVEKKKFQMAMPDPSSSGIPIPNKPV